MDYLTSKVFDIILGRALKSIYLSLPKKGQKEMEKVFSFGSEKEKSDFLKINLKILQKIFLEESEKVKNEILQLSL